MLHGSSEDYFESDRGYRAVCGTGGGRSSGGEQASPFNAERQLETNLVDKDCALSSTR
jgi:hypothetical protein